MRKYSALIALLCVLAMALTPLPLTGQDGAYNTFSGLYWCANPVACLHEQGHKLDQQLGWPSQSEAFGDAVKVFILAESNKPSPSLYLYKLFAMPEWTKSEIYANLFAWSGGDREKMPEIFREFYKK